jgi:hypothetical protein
MEQKRKVISVLELGRYSVGDLAYWVTFRRLKPCPEISVEDDWMFEAHPKILYERGPFKRLWDHKKKLPKLHHEDFKAIVSLMEVKMVVEEFRIADILRSNRTGEFYYANPDDEWMPECYLFDSVTAARREKGRIAKMISKWSGTTLQG